MFSAARLFYVDDSGAESTGCVVYAWCEVAIEDWREGLSAILTWRARLTAQHQIPKAYELHATKFANGRGDPSLTPAWNRRKVNRSTVMTDAMVTFAGEPCLGVGAVFSATPARRRAYRAEAERVYLELVQLLDARLQAAGEHGILVMDGDGNDESYITAHRQLPLGTRHLVEDPAFQSSHRSQWVQVADLVAYSAYQQVLQHPGKQFAWPWYGLLAPIDRLGGPQRI